MANNIAFTPMGKTYKLNAATTVQQVTLYSDSPSNQYMIVNHEPSGTGLPVYVRISNSATANVALPNNGSPQYAIAVAQDTRMVVSGPQVTNTAPVYVSFVSESGTPEAYIVAGEGL